MGRDLRSHLAVTAIAAATIATLSRSFGTSGWAGPVTGAAFGAIAIAGAMRMPKLERLGPLRWVVQAVAAAWYLAVVVTPAGTKYGFPHLPHLFDVMRRGILESMHGQFPAVAGIPLVAVTAAAVWGAVAVSEAAAMRGSLILTVAPWLMLFEFTAASGSRATRDWSVVVFLAATVLALYLLRVDRFESSRWDPKLATGAALLGTFGLVVGLVLPARIPGYTAESVLKWNRVNSSTQIGLSPLVSIKPRLTARQEVPMFTVDRSPTDVAPYWRLISLESFDGEVWTEGSSRRVVVRGDIYHADGIAPGAAVTRLSQTFEVNRLNGPWLPAAYLPVNVSGIDATVDPELSTLRTNSELHEGRRFMVESLIPNPSPQELRNSPVADSLVVSNSGISNEVKQIARTITKNSATQYDQVVAIVRHLRAFEYDESVPSGNSQDQVLHFLTKTKAGYCEQFAGAAAVLMRALGIPSRVAVGFLPGRPTRWGDPTLLVTTEHAHAWPEVFFEGVGWIPFEPTPRSIASPPTYQTPETVLPAPEDTSGPGAAASPGSQASAAPSAPPTTEPSAGQTLVNGGRSRIWQVPLAVLTVGSLPFLLFALKKLKVRTRYRRARTPNDKIAAAFLEVQDRAVDLGSRRGINETASEYLRELQDRFALDPEASLSLRVSYERVSFGSPEGPSPDADTSERAAGRLSSQLWKLGRPRAKLAILFSPRSLLRPGSRALENHGRARREKVSSDA